MTKTTETTETTETTDPTVRVIVLDGWTVGSYPAGHVFTVAAEQAPRLVELGAVEIAPAVPTAEPEPVAVDHVEVRVPGGFRSLPRDEARELIAAGLAEPFYPSTL